MRQQASGRTIEDGTITNADIANNAGIQRSKLERRIVPFLELIDRRSFSPSGQLPYFSGNQFGLTPWLINHSIDVQRISIVPTNGSGNVEIEVGLYDADGNLIERGSKISTSTSAVMEDVLLGSKIQLDPGLYYVGFYANGGGTFLCGPTQSAILAGVAPDHVIGTAGDVAGNRLPSTVVPSTLSANTKGVPWMKLS